MLRGILTYLVYLFKKDRQFYKNLIHILGFLPNRVSLYRAAFTHKSAAIFEKDGTKVNNERLEYLGDSILSAIAAEYIYNEFIHTDEGFMTKLRARIVKRKHLNVTAIKMGIPLMMNTHPYTTSSSKHLYGNALEALIGAIYIDRGYRAATRFFRKRMINKHIDLYSLAEKDSDYKSQLIEWSQKRKKEIEFFNREEYDSSSKKPSFQSTVKVDQQEAGHGSAGSKKEAEQKAAKDALKEISK
ncbi:MAG TPA: ribonuclease III [Bacteroidales bacterium]|nr:ribonuclease III [Bacteroidales bacterium]